MSADRQPAKIGPGRFVLVVGPSGAGKDTVLAGVKLRCAGDPAIVFPRRIVTRPASDAEDNDSLTPDAFDAAIGNGAFAFWWQAHGLKYGIPRTAEDDIRASRTVVCNVSRGVIDTVRAHYANVATVEITAPADVLAARLAGRARNTDGSLDARLQRNATFTAFQADHVIQNVGAPDDAAQALLAVIRSR